MDTLVDSMVDFVRARQINIAVAGVLTLLYLLYQYGGLLLKGREDEEMDCRPTRLSRSRSRSASRSRSRGAYQDYKLDERHGRGRRRKTHRRCHDCSLCNFEQ